MPIISAVTPGSANQAPSVAAASGVSAHGQMSTIVDGDARRTAAIANCGSPAAFRTDRTPLRQVAVVGRLQRAGIRLPVAQPGERHEQRRDDVQPRPEPERDVVVVEAIPVDEGRHAEEGRERGDRQEAEMHAVPAGGKGDPDEEVGARDVAGAHDEGRHRRTDLPRPPVAGVVREQVQQREGHEQERDDEHAQRSRLGEHAIVAHRQRCSGLGKSKRAPASHSERWLPCAGMPPASLSMRAMCSRFQVANVVLRLVKSFSGPPDPSSR